MLDEILRRISQPYSGHLRRNHLGFPKLVDNLLGRESLTRHTSPSCSRSKPLNSITQRLDSVRGSPGHICAPCAHVAESQERRVESQKYLRR